MGCPHTVKNVILLSAFNELWMCCHRLSCLVFKANRLYTDNEFRILYSSNRPKLKTWIDWISLTAIIRRCAAGFEREDIGVMTNQPYQEQRVTNKCARRRVCFYTATILVTWQTTQNAAHGTLTYHSRVYARIDKLFWRAVHWLDRLQDSSRQARHCQIQC